MLGFAEAEPPFDRYPSRFRLQSPIYAISRLAKQNFGTFQGSGTKGTAFEENIGAVPREPERIAKRHAA
jgi:hypothetical protein